MIHYSFLWKHEHAAGSQEGRKNRPCLVIMAQDDGSFLVAPVTHSPPSGTTGVVLPQSIKRRLGLGEDESWVIASELNKFTWPGFDIRTIPGRNPPTYIYGQVPPGYLRQVRSTVVELARKRLVATIGRDEGPS